MTRHGASEPTTCRESMAISRRRRSSLKPYVRSPPSRFGRRQHVIARRACTPSNRPSSSWPRLFRSCYLFIGAHLWQIVLVLLPPDFIPRRPILGVLKVAGL